MTKFLLKTVYSQLGENCFFFSRDNFFVFFEIEEIVLKDKERDQFFFEVKKRLSNIPKKDFLKYFLRLEKSINSLLKEREISARVSLAGGYLKGDVFYLKTSNKGKIFIKRDDQFGLVVEKDQFGHGKIHKDDFFIFTTSTFIDFLGNFLVFKEKILKKIDNFDNGEVFHPLLESQQEGLFIVKITDIKRDFDFFTDLKLTGITGLNFYFIIKNLISKRKKLLTFTFALVILFGLIWTTITSVRRRNYHLLEKRINQASELITQKLELAQEVVFLNPERASILLDQTKDELEKIKIEVKKSGNNNKKINELEKLVKKTEDDFFRKENIAFEEFFDLSIDNKDASIDKGYLDNGFLFLLDKKNRSIYKLFLRKKSLEKITSEKISQVDLIVGDEENLFLLIKDEGIYQSQNFKLPLRLVIKNEDWGEIIRVDLYNKNLYLLDRKKDEIWKYLKTATGFSNKRSYFNRGEAIDLSNVNSFAIDGSIYLLQKTKILKYTSGNKQEFNINLPVKEFSFDEIFTNKDLEKIYLLDKRREAIFLLSKKGDYLQQFNSPLIGQAKNFFVYDNRIFLILNHKIYQSKK
ncbi:MAG: hypothetical protein NZL96_01580 [Patescibacteria group bacterium]|nr:hypothetical protein [Patescibacteria group bacterium]